MKKKLLAVLLAVALIFSIVPVMGISALAADEAIPVVEINAANGLKASDIKSVLNNEDAFFGYNITGIATLVNQASEKGATVSSGTYYFFSTNEKNALSKPKNWTNKTQVQIRVYYEVPFTLTDAGASGAKIYLTEYDGDTLGEPIEVNSPDTIQLFTDKKYQITAEEIPGYFTEITCNNKAVSNPFTPSSAKPISVTYTLDNYASVTIIKNDGGTVEVVPTDKSKVKTTSAGEKKYAPGSNFSVKITPEVNNGYYVKSAKIKGKTLTEADVTNDQYTVSENEAYEVNAEFAKAEITLPETIEIDYDKVLNIKDPDILAAVTEQIRNAIQMGDLPQEFKDAKTAATVQYYNGEQYKIIWFDDYENLDHDVTGYTNVQKLAHRGQHNFGCGEDGTVDFGNTEKIRITVTTNYKGQKYTLTADTTAVVKDPRTATSMRRKISLSSLLPITVNYTKDNFAETLKQKIAGEISITDANKKSVDFKAEDITISPEDLTANTLLNPANVTVTYNGTTVPENADNYTDYYQPCSTTVKVHVKAANASIKLAKASKLYDGNKFDLTTSGIVTTTPEDLPYIALITGVDGDKAGFISISIPKEARKPLQIRRKATEQELQAAAIKDSWLGQMFDGFLDNIRKILPEGLQIDPDDVYFLEGNEMVLDLYPVMSKLIGDGIELNKLQDVIGQIADLVDSFTNPNQEATEGATNQNIISNLIKFFTNTIKSTSGISLNATVTLDNGPKKAGTYLIAVATGDPNYTFKTAVNYLTIKKVDLTLAFNQGLAKTYTADAFAALPDENLGYKLTGDIVNNDQVKASVLYTGRLTDGTSYSSVERPTQSGVYTQTVSLNATNYQAKAISRSITITENEKSTQFGTTVKTVVNTILKGISSLFGGRR